MVAGRVFANAGGDAEVPLGESHFSAADREGPRDHDVMWRDFESIVVRTLVKSPDGTTTSSSQSGQSRKIAPGLCASSACRGAGVGNAERQSAARRRLPSGCRPQITAIFGRTFLLHRSFVLHFTNIGQKILNAVTQLYLASNSTVIKRADSSIPRMGSEDRVVQTFWKSMVGSPGRRPAGRPGASFSAPSSRRSRTRHPRRRAAP
jgi:hypothetical protein